MNNPIARKEKLVVQEMPDEVLVYDLKQHKAHCLNKTAAFVWSQCDGQTDVSVMAQLVREEFKTPFDEALVWRALDQLSKANLLDVKLERPKDVVMQSRRRLLGKLGAAALLSVPVVMSISSPTAAVAATQACVVETICDGITNNCQPCHTSGSSDCTKQCRPKQNGGGQCVGSGAGC